MLLKILVYLNMVRTHDSICMEIIREIERAHPMEMGFFVEKRGDR